MCVLTSSWSALMADPRALMETLIGALVAKAGAEAQEKIAQFHKNRLAAGLYDEPAPLAQLG